jgi:hypothetical protein
MKRRITMRGRVLLAWLGIVALPLVAISAPQNIGGRMTPEQIAAANTPYDGRFTFARIKFTASTESGSYYGGRGRGGRGRGIDYKWDHDYPRAETHLAKILRALTLIDPNVDGGNIVPQGDPDLFNYPWAYLCEPGFWTATDEEMENLRNYLLKGGFLVVDDFGGAGEWSVFQRQMQRLLPELHMVELDVSHPIFHAFFEIEDLGKLAGSYRSRGRLPSYYGVFEDNDPGKRLMVIVNFDNDIGDFWEWSDMAYTPIALSNEAYKLGINYVIYAMTH